MSNDKIPACRQAGKYQFVVRRATKEAIFEYIHLPLGIILLFIIPLSKNRTPYPYERGSFFNSNFIVM